MGSKWMWVLMFVSLAWCLSQGCLDEERVALLQLKHFFNDNDLSDWVDGEKNSDCCQWGGVKCSNSTSRVINIDLSYARNENLGKWFLNASLFSVFEELKGLNLSANYIAGFVENEGLHKLSRLSNLEDLNLGINMFNNDILSSLPALSSLKMLSLDDNKLDGTIDLQSIDSHNKLQELGLAINEIEEVIFPKGIDKLSRLSNLEYLYLGSNKLNNDILSSLDTLPSLKEIDLSDNSLNGTINLQVVAPPLLMPIGGEGASSIVHLRQSYSSKCEAILKCWRWSSGLNSHSKLQYLHLQNNEIEEVILPQGLPSLKVLYLSDNKLKGTVDLQSLDSYNKLQYLYLDNTEIEEVIFPQALPSLKRLQLSNNSLKGAIGLQGLNNLEYLDLSYNNLDNSILSSIGALSSLKELNLFDNRLKGIVDISELHSLNNLDSLSMGDNKIDKFIFSKENTNLRNLKYLDLTNISIHDGNNLLQLLASFPSLETLYLSYNNFSQMTTEDLPHLKNTKNLKYLWMDYTNLNITFLQIIGPLTSSSLEKLSLSNCGLQGTISHPDGGTLAEFLYHQHNLQVIDLSSNNLTGEFPNWLLENNSRLYYLYLANNSLGGHFQLPIHSHMNLASLDISKNLFYGHIPKEIGGFLPRLRLLNLSQNHFDGSLPSSIGDMISLQTLDLSHNQLSGKIPEHLVEGCTSLGVLLLSNNNFQGQIFSSNFNLTNLQRLQLDGNKFTGKIPDSLSNASYLEGLYLSDNNLSSRLPSWLGNMSRLEDIMMPNNHLEGPIPSEFCQLEYLTILNLGDNNLSGNLPYCFSSSEIKHIHLSNNSFQGQLSDFLINSSGLVTLDLSYNQLHGSIPTWINLNFNLKYIILRNNNLSGELPTQLCQLNQLRLVDLSHNNLFGHIPPCLELTALHDNHNIDVDVDSTYIGISHEYRFATTQIRNEESVEFTTKTSSYRYKGKVLTYMSGIDLSCNKLTGLVPQQVGNLTRIHTLNLSHNNLSGAIPVTLSKLKQIECLDLSYNNLNGKIPSQLVELNSLSSFSVAHNNLSGKTPQRIAQFGTFEENCYAGNPFLCGLPLNKSCDIIGPPPSIPRAPVDNEKDSDFIHIETFYMSFTGSYIIVLIGIGAVLYINPYWRRMWFYFLETWMTSFYYFVVDNLPW